MNDLFYEVYQVCGSYFYGLKNMLWFIEGDVPSIGWLTMKTWCEWYYQFLHAHCTSVSWACLRWWFLCEGYVSYYVMSLWIYVLKLMKVAWIFILGDLKLNLLYEWWHGTIFMHCIAYYLTVVLRLGIRLRWKGNELEIVNVF